VTLIHEPQKKDIVVNA